MKVVNIDPSGKIRLSRKALLADADGVIGGSAPSGDEAGAGAGAGGGHDRPRGGDRGGRDRGPRPRRPRTAVTRAARFVSAVLGLALGTAVSARSGTVDLSVSGNGFQPKVVNVRKGETVRLQLTSADGEHCFALDAWRIEKRIRPGQTHRRRAGARPRGHLPVLLLPRVRRRGGARARAAGGDGIA